MASKFFDIFATIGGLKTVNNIAIIETTQDRIKTTLNDSKYFSASVNIFL